MRAIFALVLCTGLAACASKAPTYSNTSLNIAVCQKITPPAEQPLRSFEFRKLENPPTDIVAGLTSQDASAILENLNILKARESKWQSRADVLNQCIDRHIAAEATAAKPSNEKQPRKRRFGLF